MTAARRSGTDAADGRHAVTTPSGEPFSWGTTFSWERRDRRLFGPLTHWDVGRRVPAFFYAPSDTLGWSLLRAAWLGLTEPSAIIPALAESHKKLVLRRCALHWDKPSVDIN